MSRCLFEIADGAGYTCVVEPGLTAAQIQLAQGSPEPASKKHLAEVLSLGQIRHIGVALQPLPTHHLELCAEGLLDEVVFPLALHATWGKGNSPLWERARVREKHETQSRPNTPSP